MVAVGLCGYSHLALTVAIVSLTYFSNRVLDDSQWRELREWVRGLAFLIVLFDIYTLYQQVQLQRTRRELINHKQLFELITENAADMIAVIDAHGQRVYIQLSDAASTTCNNARRDCSRVERILMATTPCALLIAMGC